MLSPMDQSHIQTMTAQQQAMRDAKWRACQHWVGQLQKMFPQTETPLTPEQLIALATVMEPYSEKILSQVCGYSGIVQTQTYLPSPFQLKQALEAATGPTRDDAARERRRIAAEKERLEELLIESERASRPTYEELVATLPDSLRVASKKILPMSAEEKAAFMAKAGISQAELDKVPDQGTPEAELAFEVARELAKSFKLSAKTE